MPIDRLGKVSGTELHFLVASLMYSISFVEKSLAAMDLLNLPIFFSETSNELNAVSKPPCLIFVATVNFECMHFFAAVNSVI